MDFCAVKFLLIIEIIRGKMLKINKNNHKFMSLYLCLINPIAVYANFDAPLLQKLSQLQSSLISIGKSITALAVIAVIVCLILGKPQWKWAMYIIAGGALLMSSGSIVRWIVY